MLLFLACTNPETTQQYLSKASIGEAVEVASEGLLKINPLLQHHAWTSTMNSLSEQQCPPMEEHNGMDYWSESCTTQEGHQFLGWSLNFRGQEIEENGYTYTNFDWLSGQAQIINKNGTLLQNFGDVLHQEGFDPEGNRFVQGYSYGNFYWDDPLAEGSWLFSEVNIEYTYTFIVKGEHHFIDLQTAVSYGPNGLGSRISNFNPIYPAAIFEGIVFDTEQCAEEPIDGEIWIRDLASLWYQVLYDSESSCDGCGVAFHNDVEIGSVCSNFSMWFDWEEYPWESR